MKCPSCESEMLKSERLESSSTVREVLFCPRCKHEELLTVKTGHLAVENEFYVYIELPAKLTVEQLKCIRSLDSNSHEKPLTEFKTNLRALGYWKVGPYWPASDAEVVSDTLAENGLHCVIRPDNA
jgi:hypothetical protein